MDAAVAVAAAVGEEGGREGVIRTVCRLAQYTPVQQRQPDQPALRSADGRSRFIDTTF